MRVKKPCLLSFIILFLLSQTVRSQAQFKWAMIGVNGLTCSACTRTVEMSIRKLDFVKDVEMNLENTEGKIIFKDTAEIDISGIARAVTDAGFSVRYLTATLAFSNVTVNNGYCLNEGKYNLQFVGTKEKALNGESEIKFIGREFLPKGEFNKMKPLLINSCTDKNRKVYFVTL